MLTWVPYTFVRFLLFFVIGILLGIFFPGLVSGQVAVVGWLVLSVLYFLLRLRFLHSINAGLLGLPLLILTGYVLVFLRTESNRLDHIVNESQAILYYKVNIISYPEEKTNSWKQVGEIESVKTNEAYKEASGRVLLYFDNKDFQEPFPYGTELIIKGSPQLISSPSNPHEFDYRKYSSFRNIYHQDFLNSKNVFVTGADPRHAILGLTFASRKKSVELINGYIDGDRERAIASALILGVTDNLDDDLLKAYASSGAIHVLAVSGLHIGVLYAVIVFLFRPLRKYPNSKWALAFVSVGCLWGYAFITGMSPSVMRAVTMFTFVVLAEPLRKRSDIYNTLALSAFCLLLYDPYLIMSVGFQLSYLAVLGIVYLYPRFFFLWTPPASVLPVWKISCVSVAAQLATFPLGLLYFHQFPVYFLFSNLFIIPLSFIVLVGGLGLLGLSWVSPLAEVVGTALTFLIKLMNAGVLFTGSLPGSLIGKVYINSLQYWLLCGFIVVFILLFQVRKFWLVYVGLLMAVCFSCLQWNHQMKMQGDELIVYNVRGHSAIDITSRSQVYYFADSALKQETDHASFQTNGNRIARGIRFVHDGERFSFSRNFGGCRLIQWKNSSILQITDSEFFFTKNVPVDFILISNNSVKSLDEIFDKVRFRALIMDSSNSWWVAQQLSEQAKKMDLPFHSVLHEGAFVKEL